MVQPPTYTTWKVRCRSFEDAHALREWLEERIWLDRVMYDTVRMTPGGAEQASSQSHRLGDYFDAICISPDSGNDSFRLTFQRRPSAGRYWKDLMVGIVHKIDAAPQPAQIEIEPKAKRRLHRTDSPLFR